MIQGIISIMIQTIRIVAQIITKPRMKKIESNSGMCTHHEWKDGMWAKL